MTENNEDFVDDDGGEEYSPEIVEEAKKMGHIPLEDWKGDPDTWTPPDVFVERGKTFQPFLKAERKRLIADQERDRQRIADLEKRDKERADTFARMAKVNDAAAERAYEQAKKDILEQQAKAIEDQDGAEFARLETAKEGLVKPEPSYQEPEGPADPGEPVEFTSWVERNDWYNTDKFMKIAADGIAADIIAENPNIDFVSQLAEVEKRIRAEMPHKFTNPNRNNPSNVDGGSVNAGEVGGNNKKQSYRNLPQDAKDECDRGVASGLYKSRERYAELYYKD